MSAVAPPPKLALDNTYGVLLIAVVVAAFLHGVTCVQGWCYFLQQRDAWPLKTAVALVLLLDTVHQALITHSVYDYLVTNWGNVAVLPKLIDSLLVETVFNALTALIVQSFLTMRIYVLSHGNILLTVFAGTLVTAEFVSLTTFYGLSRYDKLFADLVHVRGLSITINALAAAGDVTIAITLCILLHRSRTGFQRSDTMINKLIIFAVNTGALTSLCALGSLVSITVAPNTFAYIGFFLCMGRLYANSFLATLNARSMIRNAVDQIAHTSNNGSNSSKGIVSTMRYRFSSMLGDGTRNQHNISIKIDKTKEMVVDHEQSTDKGDVLEMQSVAV